MGLSLYGSLPIIRAGGVPCHCRIRLTVMAPGSRTVRLLSLDLGVVPKTKASRNQAVQEEQQTGWHERHSQTRFTSDNTNRPTPGSAQASGRAAGTVIEPGIANVRHSMTYQHVSPSTANHIRLSHLRHAFCTISTMPPSPNWGGAADKPHYPASVASAASAASVSAADLLPPVPSPSTSSSPAITWTVNSGL